MHGYLKVDALGEPSAAHQRRQPRGDAVSTDSRDVSPSWPGQNQRTDQRRRSNRGGEVSPAASVDGTLCDATVGTTSAPVGDLEPRHGLSIEGGALAASALAWDSNRRVLGHTHTTAPRKGRRAGVGTNSGSRDLACCCGREGARSARRLRRPYAIRRTRGSVEYVDVLSADESWIDDACDPGWRVLWIGGRRALTVRI